jgi:hypothetical protein
MHLETDAGGYPLEVEWVYEWVCQTAKWSQSWPLPGFIPIVLFPPPGFFAASGKRQSDI